MMEIYLVGGAVRDQLLGLDIKDRDWVVVNASAEELLQQGFTQVGKDFPVFLHPETGEEYALARTERKTGSGYTGFACYAGEDVSLEDDLLRRDLTINAMAQDQQGNIIDPYQGQLDLQNKVLRHVSVAFSEDPLRVLRVARFYARYYSLGFNVAPETLTLMQKMSNSGELNQLTIERVWQETERALLEDSPTAYFELLQETGALACLFPDIDALFGVPQTPEHHPEVDTGVHTLMALNKAVELTKKAAKDDRLAVRWAVITHDLGKGKTHSDLLPKHHGHEELSEYLVKILNRKYRVPKKAARLAERVARYHTHCHRAFELKPTTVLRLLESLDAFRRPETLELYLLSCRADSTGRRGFEDYDYPQTGYLQDCFTAAQQVQVKEILQQRDLRGEALGQELRVRRINAIAKVKQDYFHGSN